MADDADIQLPGGVRVPAAELAWTYSTSGGPGGQHVNTSRTRAEVRLDVAGSPSLPDWARQRILDRLGATVSVAASDRRSQLRNRELALERLTGRLREAMTPETPRRPTRPTRASQRRRLDDKRRTSERKQGRRTGGDDG